MNITINNYSGELLKDALLTGALLQRIPSPVNRPLIRRKIHQHSETPHLRRGSGSESLAHFQDNQEKANTRVRWAKC